MYLHLNIMKGTAGHECISIKHQICCIRYIDTIHYINIFPEDYCLHFVGNMGEGLTNQNNFMFNWIVRIIYVS